MSKFVLLIHSDAKRWGDLTAEDSQAITSDYMAYSQALVDAGRSSAATRSRAPTPPRSCPAAASSRMDPSPT